MATTADHGPRITITDHVLASKLPISDEVRSDLAEVLKDIGIVGIKLSNLLRESSDAIIGKVGTINETGDIQAKLDVIANEIMSDVLDKSTYVRAMVSEEEADAVQFSYDPVAASNRAYMVCTDPLDGSSNIDCNVPVGTIFSIFALPGDKKVLEESDFLLPSDSMVGGGYILYGAATVYVYSLRGGTHGFVLDDPSQTYISRTLDMQIPKAWKNYSINEATMAYWAPQVSNFISFLKMPDGDKPAIAARYVGSFVSDFHRNSLYGGIYVYPASSQAPEGKLRLMYECAPLALLAEQMGGSATTGDRTRILDLTPTSVHQRTPLYIGNKDLVQIAGDFLADGRELPKHIARPLQACHLSEQQVAMGQEYGLDACPIMTAAAAAAAAAEPST